MTRTPKTSLSKLYSLRGRERLFVFVWGLTRWVALVLTLLAIAMFVDWKMDIKADTPKWLRTSMSLVQFVVAVAAAVFWVLLPSTRGVSLIRLAKRVEDRIRDFDHRLITAIQLTRRNAKTEGMSAELIGIVTDEAEQISSRNNLTRLADTRRLKWSAAVLVWPLSVLLFLLLFFKPDLLRILVQRQLFADVEIPRHVHLHSVTQKVWPAGDEVTIRYEVESTGPKLADDLKGTVLVMFDGQPDVKADLTVETRIDDHHAIFAARVKSTNNFRYRAWLGDGRTRIIDEVAFVPRPQVTIAGAWMLMPGYVPERPDGSRYTTQQKYGDLKLHPPSLISVLLEPRAVFQNTFFTVWDPGSLAHIRVYVQKPVTQVKLTLLDRAHDDLDAYPLRSVLMDYSGEEKQPDGSYRYYYETMIAADFEPLPGQIGANVVLNCVGRMMNLKYLSGLHVNRYGVSAVDEYGFESRRDPYRSIDIVMPDPPHVELLPERFPRPGGSITEEDIIKDLPIPPGEKVKIEYLCRSPIGFPEPVPGLGNRLNSPARLMVRVNEETTPRIYLLDEILQTPESGEYDLYRASFSNVALMQRLIKDYNGVPFHAKPGHDPVTEMPRHEAGGVYYLQTNALKKVMPDGQLKDLEIGDSIEFWIEVTDRAGNRVTERTSPKRRKEIRSPEEVARQSIELLESETRLRAIEKRQRDLGQGLIGGEPKK